MGNHPSAVADDGQSSVHRQSYTVRGDLYARSVTASTINARVVYARKITAQRAQICNQEPLLPQNYPNPPHRSITAHTLNVDAIYADEINCKTIRAYDVCVGDGQQWRAKHVEWMDREKVGWDGREDDDSEDSESDTDIERTTNEERAKRKKMMQFGAAGALGVAIGGAALAYSHHRKHEKEEEEEEKKKKEQEELRRRNEEDEKRRHNDDDEKRRRQEEDDRRRREEDERRRQQEHHQGQPQQQPVHNAPAAHHDSHEGHHDKMHGGNYHLSSRNIRVWSDGNFCYLIAECNAGGHWQESRLNLDERITNSNGEFKWVRPGEKGNFSGSAERWEIVDSGNVFVADLKMVNGQMHRRRIVLSEHITNQNGNLRYID